MEFIDQPVLNRFAAQDADKKRTGAFHTEEIPCNSTEPGVATGHHREQAQPRTGLVVRRHEPRDRSVLSGNQESEQNTRSKCVAPRTKKKPAMLPKQAEVRQHTLLHPHRFFCQLRRGRSVIISLTSGCFPDRHFACRAQFTSPALTALWGPNVIVTGKCFVAETAFPRPWLRFVIRPGRVPGDIDGDSLTTKLSELPCADIQFLFPCSQTHRRGTLSDTNLRRIPSQPTEFSDPISMTP